MDIDVLKIACRKAKESAFEDFKNYIDNALFPLTNEIYIIECDTMKAAIGRKVYAVMYNKFMISDKQHEVIEAAVNVVTKEVVIEALAYMKSII